MGGLGGGENWIAGDKARFLDRLFLVVSMTDLADSVLGELEGVDGWLTGHAAAGIGFVLIACLTVAVGFVAFKLIKRALNKA